MLYTDKTAVQAYTLTNIDVSFDAQLTSWITAMSRYMDAYCGRTLADSTPSTKLYDGNDSNELVIDEVYDISAVAVGGTAVTPYEYPSNLARKYRLVFENDYFPRGKQNVSVTGIFARFPVLSDDIKLACTILVAGIVNASNKQTEGVKSEKVGEYTVTYKNDEERSDFKRAMAILDTHKAIAF